MNSAAPSAKVGQSLQFNRFFTKDHPDPYHGITWEPRDSKISRDDGSTVSEMKGVTFPSTWGKLAGDIAVSKYFRKAGVPQPDGTTGAETSMRQVFDRIANAITQQGLLQGHLTLETAPVFQAELTWLMVRQFASFNSPVLFNVGMFESYGLEGSKGGRWATDDLGAQFQTKNTYERPAASACFIQTVGDSLESMSDFAAREIRVFQGGSGSGSNYSKIRGKNEALSGGGTSSGLISFLRWFDAGAGAIKSGGVTRRAARMVVVNADHPDIEEFIDWKVGEEHKVAALVAAGYSRDFNGEAYATVSGQNANNSVRVADDFMRLVTGGGSDTWNLTNRTDGKVAKTISAKALWRKIAQAAWECADPGVQFDTTANDWHTVPNTGRINGTNPCVEYTYVDDTACNLASLNLLKFLKPDGAFDVPAFTHTIRVFITAMDILVDYASYPSREIAVNTHKLRPLGLGYANLGALLMRLGLAYDSDEGQAVCAEITSLLTATAYDQSAQLAQVLEPFAEFTSNREPMLRVIAKHRAAAEKDAGPPRRTWFLGFPPAIAWQQTERLGQQFGYRNGQATVLAPTGCLDPETLVPTERGLVRLRTLGDTNGKQWQDLGIRVATDEGPQEASKFFVNGPTESVVTVTTSNGYTLRGTPQHRVKVVQADGEWAWKRLADLDAGDQVPIQLNTLFGEAVAVELPPFEAPYKNRRDLVGRVPRHMNVDLAEFLGLFMGNGSLHEKSVRICVSTSDPDTIEHVRALGLRLFGLEGHVNGDARSDGYTSVVFNSTRLARWFYEAGFNKTSPSEDHDGKGYAAHIPDAVLATNDRAVYGAFLRGLYEMDGTVSFGVAELSTKTRAFAGDVQSLLAAMGVPSNLQFGNLGGFSGKPVYHLRNLNVTFGARWTELVGFIGKRKQSLVRLGSEWSGVNDRIPLAKAHLDIMVPPTHATRQAVYAGWAKNGSVTRDAALEILAAQLQPDLKLAHLLQFHYDTIETAVLGEIEATVDLSVPSNVTYVANGFVSHNTIGLLMGADTTGIEPDFSLVKFKNLAGTGNLTIVNESVGPALDKLGYTASDVGSICAHVLKTGGVEGSVLRSEHLAVFDCAVAGGSGARSIAPMGHLRMVAAAQPFLSGSVSKTCNVPNEATVEEIEALYTAAWRLGLKAAAIYRDGSKVCQPLTGKTTKKAAVVVKAALPDITPPGGTPILPPAAPSRQRLPTKRRGMIQEVTISGHKLYLRTGEYTDGRPGEIRIDMHKEGATIRALLNALADATSLGLQHGVPLEKFCDTFVWSKFEPAGAVQGDDRIKRASSVVDYVFRALAVEYLKRDDLATIKEAPSPSVTPPSVHHPFQATGPEAPTALLHVNGNGNGLAPRPPTPVGKPVLGASGICSNCHGTTVRSGTCSVCLGCGETSGCS